MSERIVTTDGPLSEREFRARMAAMTDEQQDSAWLRDVLSGITVGCEDSDTWQELPRRAGLVGPLRELAETFIDLRLQALCEFVLDWDRVAAAMAGIGSRFVAGETAVEMDCFAALRAGDPVACSVHLTSWAAAQSTATAPRCHARESGAESVQEPAWPSRDAEFGRVFA